MWKDVAKYSLDLVPSERSIFHHVSKQVVNVELPNIDLPDRDASHTLDDTQLGAQASNKVIEIPKPLVEPMPA